MKRRAFLGAIGSGLLCTTLGARPPAPKKMAVITTEWRYHSHAWHMAERFLAGYPIEGQWHKPPFEVVSAYVDQFPKNDLSRQRAKQSGFTIYPTVAEALRCGKKSLAVDAILLIGEHGNYPRNSIGQKMYPRYELFKQIIEVFKKDKKTTPVFNDKHLSWKWSWAKEMHKWSKELQFPFMAGSSLPVTWRMPSIDLAYGAELEEILCVAMGGVDSYDFHALEVLQCMAERRKGGESGVTRLQALRGEDVWKAMKTNKWQKGGWDPDLFRACLCRSQTLTQAPTYSHRYPNQEQIQQWVKNPVAYRYEHADGLKATMLLLNGLVKDFTFAAKIKGQKQPLSTLFYLPPNPNVVYSAALMAKVEEMFQKGAATYPVERTLLTTGLVAAGMQSLASGHKFLKTPHLAVRYIAPKESQFWAK